jgi:hypothetical protein
MPRDEPITEAMSRAGKGTAAATDAGNRRPTPWSEVVARFGGGGWYWLATVGAGGRPHVVPVLAAWSGSAFFVASKTTARKSRDLTHDARCVVSTDLGDLHVVVEGMARRVDDRATLERASAAFAEVYGWATEITGDELDAEYGAPTSGGPPYGVYEITPRKAFGFPTDGETTTPTRWRFDP